MKNALPIVVLLSLVGLILSYSLRRVAAQDDSGGREQLSKLKIDYQELLDKYGPNHPKVLRLRQEIETRAAAVPGDVSFAETAKIPLNILYLGRIRDEGRSAAFTKFLSARFAKCVAVKREDFQRRLLEGIDVVLLDWSQQERSSAAYPSPLGPMESWSTPLLLLGSAGLIQAKPWSVIGGAG